MQFLDSRPFRLKMGYGKANTAMLESHLVEASPARGMGLCVSEGFLEGNDLH
jgi:hypothetical protein